MVGGGGAGGVIYTVVLPGIVLPGKMLLVTTRETVRPGVSIGLDIHITTRLQRLPTSGNEPYKPGRFEGRLCAPISPPFRQGIDVWHDRSGRATKRRGKKDVGRKDAGRKDAKQVPRHNCRAGTTVG